MIDVNGSRFHLLLGEADWMRARTAMGEPAFPPESSPPGAARQVEWNGPRQEATLWQDAFRFAGGKGERVAIDARRGAARDRFGNWYWIAPDRHAILVCSSGSQQVATFWPPAGSAACMSPADQGGFRAVASTAAPPLTLQGLAVTEDHYLVAGTTGQAPTAGLLIFDLYAGGPPRQRLWPVTFAPYDLDARPGGGVWVLDRMNRRVWELDRRFDIVTYGSPMPAPLDEGRFASADGSRCADAVWRVPIREDQGWLIALSDPIGVAALPGGGVLVLERDAGHGFARVLWLEKGAARGTPISTESMARHIAQDEGGSPFTLIAHDFALGATVAGDPDTWSGRVYIVGADGNQAYAFGVILHSDRLELDARPEYFPMRLFGGRAVVASAGEPWYDCGDSWVKLVRQDRPRFAGEGELWTPVFDSGEPSCVWHRLMLDACIPSTAGVDVYSRAADDWRELTLTEWLSPAERRALGAPDVAAPDDPIGEGDLADWQREPSPRLRGDGPELPYLAAASGAGRGTWELLFQRAQGRYLQVKLVLRGDGRSTPRLRALRVWYPRFSYLERYLPAVYREDAPSASFVDRFLANFEGIFTTIEDRIAAAQMLFDVASAPPDALDWLGRWFGVALDPGWTDDRRRLFLRHAVDFFAARGTVRGLQLALRLALDECVDDRLFTEAGAAARGAAPIRIIERFRARRTPRALLGDVTTAVLGPQRFDPSARWVPRAGAEDLHRRYREALGQPAGSEFPLAAAGAPAGWSDFAEQTLGFVPRAGAAERARWQRFLQHRHISIGALNSAFGSTWSSFDAIPLPADEPSPAALASAWRAFLDAVSSRERQLWQDFLARRYRNVSALNAAWRTHWSAFAAISLTDRLPADVEPLTDWFQFEGTVLGMHRTAHRFTVMMPVPGHLRTDTPAQRRRVALAQAVLDLEKPAHTAYDMRFYWAMFRLGEARLGDDTVIALGSRSPELMGPMVLGEGYLAEAFLAAQAGADTPDRLQIGRDRVGRSTRLGGP